MNINKTTERLEVEDEDERHRRLQASMQKLDSTSRPPTAPNSSTSFDFGDRTTFAVNPPSELLARVQSFLPEIEASNAILSQHFESDPKSVDIETIEEGAEQYIEMNLGLGVFEHRKNDDEHVDDFEMGTSSSSDSSESDDDQSSDTDTDDSSEIITSYSAHPRIIKPLPRRSLSARSPRIMVLGEQEPSTSPRSD